MRGIVTCCWGKIDSCRVVHQPFENSLSLSLLRHLFTKWWLSKMAPECLSIQTYVFTFVVQFWWNLMCDKCWLAAVPTFEPSSIPKSSDIHWHLLSKLQHAHYQHLSSPVALSSGPTSRFTVAINRPIYRRVETAGIEWNRPHWPKIPPIKFHCAKPRPIYRCEWAVFIHTEKSAEVFVAPTNQFVDGDVSHAPKLVEDKNMENSKREFDVKLIESVKTPHCCGTAIWTCTSWRKKACGMAGNSRQARIKCR